MNRKSIITICMLLCILTLVGCKSSAAKETEKAIMQVGEVTLDSGDAIEYAEKRYMALTEKQKNQVTNYFTLILAKEQYDILVTANKIDEHIGQIDLTDVISSASLIKECEELYNEAEEDVKEKVINYDVLEDAINQLKNYRIVLTKDNLWNYIDMTVSFTNTRSEKAFVLMGIAWYDEKSDMTVEIKPKTSLVFKDVAFTIDLNVFDYEDDSIIHVKLDQSGCFSYKAGIDATRLIADGPSYMETRMSTWGVRGELVYE